MPRSARRALWCAWPRIPTTRRSAAAAPSPATSIAALAAGAATVYVVVLDVTGVFARKERALEAYTTARAGVDYLRTARGLAADRSAAGGLGGAGYAEGFLTLPADRHAELVAAVTGAAKVDRREL